MLKIGDKAPSFSILSDENKMIYSDSLRGKNCILYFYPKDNTPGCTREACDFRDHISLITRQNALVIGISKDKPSKHQKFKEKYQLPFTLLADEAGEVCQAYDVFRPKSLFGHTFLGIVRTTFLIDAEGFIRAIWPKVKIDGHVEEILQALAKLKS